MIPADAEARRRATTDFARNLVVLAGAGTGKTSLLVERVLVAVGSGRAPLDRIAAITFTEKATGEMRERLGDAFEALRGLAAGETPPAEGSPGEARRALAFLRDEEGIEARAIEDRALRALDALDRASVTTIHGFCADLLRAHPAAAGIDPGFAVDPGEGYDALFEEGFRSWLTEELGRVSTEGIDWPALLRDAGVGALRAVAYDLGRLGVEIPGAYDASSGRAAIAASAGRLLPAIEELVAALPMLPGKPAGYLREVREVLALAAAGEIEEAVASARTLAEETSSLPDPGKKPSSAERERYRRLGREARALVSDLAAIDEDLARRVFDAVRPFALSLQGEQRRIGLLGFHALLSLAAALLRDDAEVRERVKERWLAILVDEFQDTDPLQYDVVLALGEAPGRRAPSPGKLFIVGDAKQSIYRFRGADYAAFRSAVETIRADGGAVLDLTTNFRSVPEVLDPVNRLFTAAGSAWVASDYQPRYVPVDSYASPDAARGARVEIWTVDVPAGANADARREAEAAVLAEGIREEASWGRVLVLLRAFTSIDLYAAALRDAGIPFVARSGRDFLDRPEIAHALAALRALSLPEDAAALLAYLRSPLGGVPDDELARHVVEGSALRVGAEASAAATPALAAAFARLEELRGRCDGLPVDALVRRVIDETAAIPLSALAFDGAQRVANLELLSSRAAALSRDGRRSLGEILDLLESETTPVLEGDAPLADEGGNAVRILTVHAAKGLEAPVVFLPDLAREAVVTRGAPESSTLMPSSAARAAAAIERRAHERAEATRLLYVAATRAAERLVLLVSPPSRGEIDLYPWLDPLRAWGYDAFAPPPDGPLAAPGVVHARRAVPPSRRRASVEASDPGGGAAEAYLGAVADVAARALPLRSPSALVGEDDRGEGSASGVRRDLARAAGVAVHRAVARFARDGSLLPEDPDPEVAAEARRILRGFEASPLARRLGEVEVLGRETAILTRGWRGRADLVYRERDGTVVVADYKSDADPAGGAERYAPQLSVYAAAIGEALGLPTRPRAELWWLRSGTIEIVETDS